MDDDDLTPDERLGLRARLHGAVPDPPSTTGWVGSIAGLRRRRRHATVMSGAVLALAVSGGAVGASVVTGRTPLPWSGSPGETTIYLLRAETEREWRHYLAPVHVAVPGRDSAALEAARALVQHQPADDGPLVNGWSTLMIEPRPIAEVVDVRLEDDLIVVELDRDAWDPMPNVACDCPRGRLVVQQLVYTVQAALDSDAPVQLVVGDEPARGVWAFPTRNPVGADPRALAP